MLRRIPRVRQGAVPHYFSSILFLMSLVLLANAFLLVASALIPIPIVGCTIFRLAGLQSAMGGDRRRRS